MKPTVIALLTILLAACAAPSYTPTTKAGVECKRTCAQNQQLCSGPAGVCNRGYANCIQSCIDEEHLTK